MIWQQSELNYPFRINTHDLFKLRIILFDFKTGETLDWQWVSFTNTGELSISKGDFQTYLAPFLQGSSIRPELVADYGHLLVALSVSTILLPEDIARRMRRLKYRYTTTNSTVKFVFVATTGKSGTSYLRDLLRTAAGNVIAEHEPEPTYEASRPLYDLVFKHSL